ncbi:hypothetical protein D3877_28770 [Azospirillum cavernae]|uniref:Uncharacterized protein n=1 Tax=Azospirillum cavernae TaxID=2320860 RepID=A0A418VL43_9PROT|nr:hypothetical protein [Azospirillum cavernae]RJF76875.1 hypothetical protein D3877_28770 [Azospirillum cavernae]
MEVEVFKFPERMLAAIETGMAFGRECVFDWDFTAWSTDPVGRTVEEFKRRPRLSFYVEPEQEADLQRHMRSLAHKGREYQMRKPHEPYCGIRKEHLLFRVSNIG